MKLDEIKAAVENERYKCHMGSVISPRVFAKQCSIILNLIAALEKAVEQRDRYVAKSIKLLDDRYHDEIKLISDEENAELSEILEGK